LHARGIIFFFQAEDGIRDFHVTGVQTCALPICLITGADTAHDGLVMTYSVEQLRDAVARDLESLLNSRSVVDFEAPDTTHWVRRSEERRVGKEGRTRWRP